jgi:hypothetical protein
LFASLSIVKYVIFSGLEARCIGSFALKVPTDNRKKAKVSKEDWFPDCIAVSSKHQIYIGIVKDDSIPGTSVAVYDANGKYRADVSGLGLGNCCRGLAFNKLDTLACAVWNDGHNSVRLFLAEPKVADTTIDLDVKQVSALAFDGNDQLYATHWSGNVSVFGDHPQRSKVAILLLAL